MICLKTNKQNQAKQIRLLPYTSSPERMYFGIWFPLLQQLCPELCSMHWLKYVYPPHHSTMSRMWHKVSFLAEFTRFDFWVSLLLDQLPYQECRVQISGNVYESYLIKTGFFLLKKYNHLSQIICHKCNHWIFGMGQWQNYFNFAKVCFEAIQNDSKSNTLLQTWTEINHSNFGC